MTKSTKLLVVLMAVLMCLSVVFTACTTPIVYSVTFGDQPAVSVNEGESVTAPDYNPNDALKTFLGWAKEEGKTTSSDVVFAKGAVLKYEDLGEHATAEGVLVLYPVLSTKKTVSLTIGSQAPVTLVEGDQTSVQAPAVTLGAKQELVGWATTADATEAQIAVDDLINYATVQALAVDGAVTLYPVIKTYDLVVGIVNVKFDLKEEDGTIVHDVYYYLDLVKADFEATHPNANVLYRVYDGSVAECGAQITADGDVDVIMAGNNIDDPEDGNIAILAKARLATKYNPDNSRRGALVVQSDLALDMYAMLIGSENKSIEITIGETATVVNKALGNTVDTSALTDPSGRVLVGFDRDATKTTPEILGSVIDYTAVEKLATDGKVTLHPIWGAYDLIVAIWTGTSSSVYATEKQVEDFRTGFAQFLEGMGITDAVVRIDAVSGSSKADNATYYPTQVASDVLIVLGGPNVATQCGTDGKFKVINFTFDSTRYASLYTERLSTEQLAYLGMFLAYACEDEVEVTIGQSATTLSLLEGNSVDTSAVEVPAGKKIAGWALTADAEKPLIVGALTYDSVAEHATEGKVTLYPVYEDDVVVHLVFDVLFKNITQDQLDKLIADFKASLVAGGDTTEYNIVVRNDFDGKGADFLARVKSAGDVDVVLGASNLVDQTGNEILVKTGDGAYGQLLAVDGSTRYVGMVDGAVHSELAIKFVKFCQTAPVVEPNPDPTPEVYDLVVAFFSASYDNVETYMAQVEADFALLYPDKKIEYRLYSGNVATAGEKLKADGDVDVVIAGNNIDKDTGANVTIIEKELLITKYNPDTKRRVAIIVESELARAFYTFATTEPTAE